MTTIACKDYIIAYDSRCLSGDTIISDCCEKKVTVDGVNFFMSGSTSERDAIIDSYFGRDNKPQTRCSALVVDHGVLWYCGYNSDDGFFKCRESWDEPRVVGSGQDHAITAMDMGATAKEAVKMAMKRDVATGGRIRTYKVKL